MGDRASGRREQGALEKGATHEHMTSRPLDPLDIPCYTTGVAPIKISQWAGVAQVVARNFQSALDYIAALGAGGNASV